MTKKRLLNLALVALISGSGLVPALGRAALLYTGSASQVAYRGESFVMEWYLDTQGKSINALSLTVRYQPEALEAVSVTTGGSAFDLWVKPPEIDRAAGAIRLVGGLSGGVAHERLPVFRATFRPLREGPAKISIDPASELLLADGSGTTEPMIFNEITFAVNPPDAKPAAVASPTHPDQEAWYKNRNAVIMVQAKQGEEYSYSFSSNLEIIPDASPDDATEPIHFNDLPDGIYYFKLNSRTGEENWQEAAVYRVKIDGTPPGRFEPVLVSDDSVFGGAPFLSMRATDEVSGVKHYEVKSGLLRDWHKTSDPYFALPGLVLGDTIQVKVVDEAGNERIEEIPVDRTLAKSVLYRWDFWVIMIGILATASLAVWAYFKLLKKYKI